MKQDENGVMHCNDAKMKDFDRALDIGLVTPNMRESIESFWKSKDSMKPMNRKLSKATKAKAAEYITALRAQIKKDIGIELKGKSLKFVRQAYESKLHQEEKEQEKDLAAHDALCDAINTWRITHSISNTDCRRHLDGYLDCLPSTETQEQQIYNSQDFSTTHEILREYEENSHSKLSKFKSRE